MFQTFTPLSRQNSFNCRVEDLGRKYCEIILKPSLNPNHIRGKLVVRPGFLLGLGSLDYHGISVELQADLISGRADGRGKMRRALLNSVPTATTVYKSRVFSLAAGDEAGMRKGHPGFETRHKLDPTVSNFRFELPLPVHEALPASLRCPNGEIQYSIVAYIRTEYKYKEMERCRFNFYGHYLRPIGQETLQIREVASAAGMKVILRSPNKFYFSIEKIPFYVNIQMDQENLQPPVVTLVVKLVRRIYIHTNGDQKLDEEVTDSSSFKNVKIVGTEYCVNGKLKLHRKLPIGNNIPVPTFNEDYEPGIKVQYFLECDINGEPSVDFHFCEEIIVVTGECSPESGEPSPVIRSTILSRMGSSSLGLSLLSMLPPTYSRVVSRRGSLVSTETLPPHYDDLGEVKEEGNEKHKH